jgi:hypothetical protein
LLDANLANGRPVKQGYRFVYTPGTNGSQKVTAFALVARPAQPGVTGKRYFFLDEEGVVRQSDTYIVGPRSQPVDGGPSSEEGRKNEAAAISNMRAYNQALTKYAGKCPQQGYPATLSQLGPGARDCAHANLIDARLAVQDVRQQGYVYTYSTGTTGSDKVTVFALVARPEGPGSIGARFFFLDESGIIRQSPTPIIGPNSKPLDEEDPDHEDGRAGQHAETGKR